MSSSRFAPTPLIVAVLFAILGVAAVLVPQFASGTPLDEYGPLAAAAFGFLTLLFVLISYIKGGKTEETVEVGETVIESDTELVAEESVSMPMTRAEKKAAKAAEKEAAKAAKEQEKLDKKAAKDSKKITGDDKEDSDWVSEMKDLEETSLSGETVETTVVEEEPTFTMEEVSSATDLPTYEEYDSATEEISAVVSTDEAEVPEWATSVYNDPSFVVPFSQEEADESTETAEDIETELDVVAAEVAEVGNLLDEEDHADMSDENTYVEETPVVEEYVEETPVVEEYVEETPVVEYDEESPEFKIEQISMQMTELVSAARAEVQWLRNQNEQEKNKHGEESARLSNALNEAQVELDYMADTLSAKEIKEREAEAARRAKVAEMEEKAAAAVAEREAAIARMRQLRVAILSKEPLDQDLLNIVEKALRDMHDEHEDVSVPQEYGYGDDEENSTQY